MNQHAGSSVGPLEPMNSPVPVEIRHIKVRDLDSFARETIAALRPGEVVPISSSRAHAQARNPHADPDDVGLLVAYREGRCVGTLGLVPGVLRSGERLEKVDWLSAWYVPPEYRNTGAGERLLLHALGLRRNLAASDFSEQAGKVYEAMRFKPLGPLRFVTADLSRFNVLGLPFRALAKAVRKLRPTWADLLDRSGRAAGRPSKALLLNWLFVATAADRRRYATRRIDRIDVAAVELDADRDRRGPVRFERPPEVINWMLADRWVVTDPGEAVPGYYFRDHDPNFEFVALEVTDRAVGHRLGFVVLRADAIHGPRTITVLDHYFVNPADECCLLPLAVERARAFGADRIVLPPACRAAVEASPRLRPFFRVAERPYRLRLARADEALSRDLDRITLDLSDGEVPFA